MSNKNNLQNPEHQAEKLILLSAGGTGGHMFPAAALAHDLVSRGYEVALATDSRGSRYKDSFPSIPLYTLAAGTLGAGISGKLKGLSQLGLGIWQARRLLNKLNPALVIGFGGYPSVPAVYMAQRRKIPTVIHEQNAVLGWANSLLAPRADRIALSLPNVVGLEEVDTVRSVITGNPVRESIAALYTKAYPAPKEGGTLRIFVMGGSQGAQVFSDVVPATLAKLSNAYRSRLEVIQQCRKADLERVHTLYKQANITARLADFFDDVPEIMAQSHLVISRSGASTVAEVTAAGRPAIFVPYPHHADQQQKINADSVADAGGAWVMTENGFTEEALQARLETFLQNPETLFRAAEASRSCGKPDAARKLGNLVTAMASGWDKEAFQPFDVTQSRQ